MLDNLDLGPDAQINHLAAVMRGNAVSGAVANLAQPAPGCFLSIDPEARVEGEYSTAGGALMNLSYRVGAAPRWIALHMAMGNVSFAGRAVMGIVLKSQAPAAVTFRVCLRTGSQGNFTDCFFDKHVVAFAQASTHVDLLRLEDHPGRIPQEAQPRELLLFLPPRDSRILLQDLRVFVV